MEKIIPTICRLAYIELSADAQEKMEKDLGNMLEWIGALNQWCPSEAGAKASCQTSEFVPHHTPLVQELPLSTLHQDVLRESSADATAPTLWDNFSVPGAAPREEILCNAPLAEAGYFLVPTVIG